MPIAAAAIALNPPSTTRSPRVNGWRPSCAPESAVVVIPVGPQSSASPSFVVSSHFIEDVIAMRHGLFANLHGARTERRRSGESAAIPVVKFEEHVTHVHRITDAHAGDDANRMVDRIADLRPARTEEIAGD